MGARRLAELRPLTQRERAAGCGARAIRTVEQAETLLHPYLGEFRKDGFEAPSPLYPFTGAAVETLLEHSDRKPRDILRKAAALIEQGAEKNWEEITPERAAKVLESFRTDDDFGLDFESLSAGEAVLD